MSEKFKPVKGDRVRVVLEGEVKHVYSDGDLHIESAKYYKTEVPREGIISIEKIEPPVEVFKPGDVVRGKVFGHVFTIADDGYVSHSTGAFRPGYNEFTSRGYEKVSLG